MDEVFKALADPTRRAILDSLSECNGQTLGELCGRFPMTRQAVMKHLAVLEAADLVVALWRGRKKLHYLNPAPIGEIYDRWIGKYERQHPQALGTLKRALEAPGNKKPEMMEPCKSQNSCTSPTSTRRRKSCGTH
jgi:DNA-binding transcriptional ArsR family regulator